LIGLVLTDDRSSENWLQIFIRTRGQIGVYNNAIGDMLALEMVMLPVIVQSNNGNRSVVCDWGTLLGRIEHKNGLLYPDDGRAGIFRNVGNYPSTRPDVTEDLNLQEDRRENPLPATCTVLDEFPSD
jgi:hypothetical protein